MVVLLYSPEGYLLIVDANHSMIIDEDIDAIIQKGEEKTQALLSKYEGLNLDDLANFKSDMGAQQWEGENFSNKVCCLRKAAPLVLYSSRLPLQPKGNLVWIEPAKRQASRANPNYSVDQYYQAAMRVGPPKVDKGPKVAKAPKHVTM
jgi:SWI/SNF-related matrix-associated actin-dependent regulator of chromatin subfamily A member 5